MSKISDIKKVPKSKHVDVDDQTKESSINVHNTTISTTENTVTEDATTKKGMFDPKKLKIVFMGTGVFAGSILKEISNHADTAKLTIITQPDKKIGRKKSTISRNLAENPVREFAKTENLNLYQPHALDDEAISTIKKFKPDVIIVSSYGKILPEDILKIPKQGSINVHASLLPKLRGASPVQNALLIGLEETGVTIMQMDKGLDTGDIIAQEKVAIQKHEKADELLKRMSIIGATLLAQTMPEWLQNHIQATPQDSSQATLCQLIDREDGHIQWTQPTQEVYNQYRALYPWPGIFAYWEETQNHIIRLKLRAIYPYTQEMTDEQKNLAPGTVFIGRDQLCIKTFDTAIIVETVQPECKIVMPVYDFLNGHKTFDGAILR